MNISEMILYLHRPFFAEIVSDRTSDPMRSPYALSYLTVVERCDVGFPQPSPKSYPYMQVTIQVVAQLYELYPAVTARHWVFWVSRPPQGTYANSAQYHSFNAAACMAVLSLRRPDDALVHVALSQVDAAIHLFTQVLKYRPRPTITSNLAWLLRIRQRIRSSSPADNLTNTPGNVGNCDPNDNDDNVTDLVGLQTRLVERAVVSAPAIKPRLPETSLRREPAPRPVQIPAFPAYGEGEVETSPTVAFTTPDTTADLFVRSRSSHHWTFWIEAIVATTFELLLHRSSPYSG